MIDWLEIGPDIKIACGDAREVLASVAAESVNCVVTSPPYWGLRDYGTASWEGGDERCEHKAPVTGGKTKGSALAGPGNREGYSADGQYRGVCPKCGARRIDDQIGLEATPAEYVAKMVEVFREVRRVLRKDGTLWLNMGDCYATNSAGNKIPSGFQQKSKAGQTGALAQFGGGYRSTVVDGLKPKDLVGMPWRLAFALQADGWWLRSDIIWSKPDPMPESCRDRPTKAHEYVFLMSKSARYHYDADVVREDAIWANDRRAGNGRIAYDGKRKGLPGTGQEAFVSINPAGRNRRTVWEIPTQAYPEAHFATFPEKLVEPCILAGCPEGGVVLDPFVGSGTTLLVAARHGHKAIGIDLNAKYLELARKRIAAEVAQGKLEFAVTA